MLRLGGRRQILLVASVLVATLIIPTDPASASSEAGRLLGLINEARSSSGLGAVTLEGSLTSIAQAHAERMAAAGRLFHNGSFPDAAGEWLFTGENVGRGPGVDAVHESFMRDPTHRANVLAGKFRLVGIGLHRVGDELWVVEDYLTRPDTPPEAMAAQPQPAQSPPAPAAPAPSSAARPRPAPPAKAPAPPPPANEPEPPAPAPVLYEPMLRWDEAPPPGPPRAPRFPLRLASSVMNPFALGPRPAPPVGFSPIPEPLMPPLIRWISTLTTQGRLALG